MKTLETPDLITSVPSQEAMTTDCSEVGDALEGVTTDEAIKFLGSLNMDLDCDDESDESNSGYQHHLPTRTEVR